MFPAFQQGFVDIALVQLAIADQGDHPAFGAVTPIAGVDVILDQAGETGHGDAEADRAGREIDVVAVLGPRRIGLGAAEGAKTLQLVASLVA